MTISPAKPDEKFIEEHRTLVLNIAKRIRREFDLTCEESDLIAFGFQGLLEAHARFDASRGVQFNTFAFYRVRGAVLDGVRTMAFLPRRAHAKLKAAEAADQIGEGLAEAQAQRPPGAEESAAADAAVVDATLGKLSAAYVLSALGHDQESAPPNAEEALVEAGEQARVRAALASLPERERKLVEGFYFEGRQFDVVAAELGISKSWASRLHTKALELLRAALANE